MPLIKKERRLPHSDDLVNYKSLLGIVIPVAAIMTTIIIFSFQNTTKSQEDHLKNALNQQLQQLRLIIDTHAQTPHLQAATQEQIRSMETRFEQRANRVLDGVKDNANAMREIAELVLSEEDITRTRINKLEKSVIKISRQIGIDINKN